TPATEESRIEESICQLTRGARAGDAREEAMACIRRPHPAGTLLAVQSQCEYPQILTPEGLVKFVSEPNRLRLQVVAKPLIAKHPAEPCRSKFGCEYISLHFTERNWRFSQTAVGMKDRIA